MDHPMMYLILVGGIVFTGLFMYFVIKRENDRTKIFAQTANELGLLFDPKGTPEHEVQYSQFPLFHRGRDFSIGRGTLFAAWYGSKTKNVMKGIYKDLDFQVFDYTYSTGYRRSRRTYYYTVVGCTLPANSFPSFVLGPENFLNKLGKVFGFQDINFETYPKFSSSYLLQGTDETAVRSLFNGPLLDYFENQPAKWSVECLDRRVILYPHGSRQMNRIKPEEIQTTLDHAAEMVKALTAAVRASGSNISGNVTGNEPDDNPGEFRLRI